MYREMRERVFFVVVLSLPVFALAKGPATNAASFLTIGFGSRAQSLGNAFVALADDASSTYFNPAGLAQTTYKPFATREIQASRSSWFQGINIDQLAIANLGSSALSWGFLTTSLRVGDLEQRTTETEKPDGFFTAEDRSLGLSLAWRPSANPLALGVTTKFIQQRIASAQGESMALDLGAQLPFRYGEQNFSLGFALRNLGPKLRLGSSGAPLPLSYHLGFAHRGLMNQVLEVTRQQNGTTNVSLGTEYWFLGVFGIRGGYNYARGQSPESDKILGLSFQPGITGGFGFKVMNAFGIDYAFVPFGDLGFAHRFTMNYRF